MLWYHGKGEFFDTEKEWPSQSKKTAFLEMSHLEESKKSRHLKVGQNDWSSDYVWELNDCHKVSKGQQNSCTVVTLSQVQVLNTIPGSLRILKQVEKYLSITVYQRHQPDHIIEKREKLISSIIRTSYTAVNPRSSHKHTCLQTPS